MCGEGYYTATSSAKDATGFFCIFTICTLTTFKNTLYPCFLLHIYSKRRKIEEGLSRIYGSGRGFGRASQELSRTLPGLCNDFSSEKVSRR